MHVGTSAKNKMYCKNIKRGPRDNNWQRRSETAGGKRRGRSNACALCACCCVSVGARDRVRRYNIRYVCVSVCVRACVCGFVTKWRRLGIDAVVMWPRPSNGGLSDGANSIPLAGATYVQRPQPPRPPFWRLFRINTNFE